MFDVSGACVYVYRHVHLMCLLSIEPQEKPDANDPTTVQRHCEEACHRDEAIILDAAIMTLKILTPLTTRPYEAEYLKHKTRHILALTTTLATNLRRYKSYQS